MILAADIGGTKTNVALFEPEGVALGPPLREQKFRSAAYDSLEAILKEFIGDTQLSLTAACFGIAAPIIEGEARTPNLKWVVSSRSLATLLNLPRVSVINDLEATANGIPSLNESQLFTLNAGEPKAEGHRALIAAGTGLGMAGIFYREGHYHPIPSEGGHMDFSPRTALEVELFQYLMERFPAHVSYERVLSGPGLFNIYSFLRDRGYGEEPDWLAQEMDAGDKTAAVSNAAVSGKCSLAAQALDMFVSFYGAMAGNLALLFVATGGLYVGGGIAPRISEKMKDGTFMKAFVEKGRLTSLLQEIPVQLILEDKTALLGAARAAINSN